MHGSWYTHPVIFACRCLCLCLCRGLPCMARGQVEKVEDCVAVGDEVWIKVTGANQEDGKLSFSMKLVDQGDGADLDPDNSEAGRQARRHAPLACAVVLAA